MIKDGSDNTEKRSVQMCISQQCLLSVGIVLVFLLAGCGYNQNSKALSSSTGVPVTSSVTLQVGATSYGSGSTISVTIKSQSQQTISFVDHQTNCTVIQLERRGANSWEPVAPCMLKIMTRIHKLNVGESLEVKLAAPGQWPTGLYRARLDYGVRSETGGDMSTAVYSSEFHVVG